MTNSKTIKAIYRAGYTSYDGLDTYAAIPTRNVPIDALNPFLFLNHHGLQTYPPDNKGLPFGPHPHKGFETVTFIIKGDLVHKDSTGFNSNIKSGGIQWMTAGNGIIHSETSSEEFQEKGGEIEILQLWLNLPARFKNVAPNYIGLQKEQVPEISFDNGSTIVNLVSGSWGEHKGPIQSLADVHLSIIQIKKETRFNFDIPANRTVLFYVINGNIIINDSEAEIHDLVEFDLEGETINILAKENAMVLFGHANPIDEPIAAHGPFVMNTHEEIRQAFVDYHEGKFGVWQH